MFLIASSFIEGYKSSSHFPQEPTGQNQIFCPPPRLALGRTEQRIQLRLRSANQVLEPQDAVFLCLDNLSFNLWVVTTSLESWKESQGGMAHVWTAPSMYAFQCCVHSRQCQSTWEPPARSAGCRSVASSELEMKAEARLATSFPPLSTVN